MSTLLLVDVSYQCHRATHANPRLTCGDVFTGGIYGFFTILGKMVRETRATHLGFCMDWPPYLRSRDYPLYKRVSRKAQDPVIRARVEQTKLLVWGALGTIGANVYGSQGFESDDYIGALATRNRHRFERIVAGSNDSDLWQLLWMPNFALYASDIEHLVTPATLDAYKLTPDQHLLATALMGSHNDVAGIAGVGQVTAFKAAKDPALLRKYRADHAEMIDRNLRLMRLPHPELPAEAGLLKPRPSFNPRSLYAALGRFDIDVTDSMVRAFEQTAV